MMINKKTVLAASIALAYSFPSLADQSMRIVLEANSNKASALKSELLSNNIKIEKELSSLESFAISINKTQLANVTGLTNVKTFYPDVPRKLMSEGTSQYIPYGLSMVQADQVQYQGGQKVCVIDSGYALEHPDLPSAGVTGSDDGGAGVWYQDPFGHGTHVAGTIAAIDNEFGTTGIVDDHSLDMHIVRVFAGNGSWAYASDLAGAIDECQQAGSTVISMSLGGKYSSPIEEKALDKVARANILMVAAAGNAGEASHSYPASYDSVISVAAVDSTKNHASFSQRSSQIELAAPGVNIFSTVPVDRARFSKFNVTQDTVNFQYYGMDGSRFGTVTGELVDCGLGTQSCGDVTGKICLIERGEIPFYKKVEQCEADGGVGVIIRNNNQSQLIGTINPTSMIAGSVTRNEGLNLMDNLGKKTTITVAEFSDHDFKSGTSMATPHVSGVAALVWSNYPDCSANGIRLALRASADDQGDMGYDHAYGWGIVQAKAAVDYIAENGCKASSNVLRGGDGSAH
ncbi:MULTISPECIES: S8 family serine peptidase [Pseudoalteromonas]|uniref:S8 family serine peptidase n=1 Tax=Pseudoalteromonas TaxID=53246 RepID=UPI002729FA20|nr:S8 family serine peptidase [Pseudoalteromonas sp.]